MTPRDEHITIDNGKVAGADDFSESLTNAERSAIVRWLNVGSIVLKDFQRERFVPTWSTDAEMVEFEDNFTAALGKAPVFSGTVFRGVAASPYWPDYVKELRDLIASDAEFVLPSHVSASAAKEIAVGHCFVEADDQPRLISVLLEFHVRTARGLAPFRHAAKDEEEVVLLRGSRYRRSELIRLPDPRTGQDGGT